MDPTPNDEDALSERSLAVLMEAAQWADEPCRICGRMLSSEDIVTDTYFTGFIQDGRRTAAHGVCWRNMIEFVRSLDQALFDRLFR